MRSICTYKLQTIKNDHPGTSSITETGENLNKVPTLLQVELQFGKNERSFCSAK